MGEKVYGAKIEILKGDITELKVDAIVNAANNSLLGGGGVDGAIHKAAGYIVLEQCKKIGGCATGEAVITTGGNLKANYIIHTVGPIYGNDSRNQKRLLYNAYYNYLKKAVEYGLKTIAFPSISTGAYGYPIEESIKIVEEAIKIFTKEHENMIDVIKLIFLDNIQYDYYMKNFLQ